LRDYHKGVSIRKEREMKKFYVKGEWQGSYGVWGFVKAKDIIKALSLAKAEHPELHRLSVGLS